MKLSIALLITTLAAVEASGAFKWANLCRRLSFEKVVGYMPGSQVRHRSVSLSALWCVLNLTIDITEHQYSNIYTPIRHRMMDFRDPHTTIYAALKELHRLISAHRLYNHTAIEFAEAIDDTHYFRNLVE